MLKPIFLKLARALSKLKWEISFSRPFCWIKSSFFTEKLCPWKIIHFLYGLKNRTDLSVKPKVEPLSLNIQTASTYQWFPALLFNLRKYSLESPEVYFLAWKSFAIVMLVGGGCQLWSCEGSFWEAATSGGCPLHLQIIVIITSIINIAIHSGNANHHHSSSPPPPPPNPQTNAWTKVTDSCNQ